MVDIGYVIRELRIENKLTQQKLAEFINVSSAAIIAWESGRKFPSIEHLILLAKFFGVPLNYVAGVDRRKCMVIDNLTQNQRNLLRTLVLDMQDSGKKTVGFSERRKDILDGFFKEFKLKKPGIHTI